MHTNHSKKIKKAMLDLIFEQVFHKEMRMTIERFIEFQAEKGFPFGELTLLHYKMLNGVDTEEIYRVCAVVELLILSFDILDDLEDDDSLNGRQPWLEHQDLALNITTILLFLNSSVLRESRFPNKELAIDLYNKYALHSIKGQHDDLLNGCRTESDYVSMTIEKSGSLVLLACSMGAVLADKNYPFEIEIYSRYIGVIAQITNDIKDCQDWNGKNDLLNKKYTLPTIYLLNHNDKELDLIRDYYQDKIGKIQILNIKEWISNKLVANGAIIYAEVMKRTYQKKAIAEIERMNIAPSYVDHLFKYIL